MKDSIREIGKMITSKSKDAATLLPKVQQAIDKVDSATVTRVTRSGLVLPDVAALEFARAVHWRQPAREMAQETQRATDDSGANLATFAGSRFKAFQHFAQQPPVPPLMVAVYSVLAARGAAGVKVAVVPTNVTAPATGVVPGPVSL